MDAGEREAWDKVLVEVHQEVRAHASDYTEAGAWLDSEYSEQRCRELQASAQHVANIRTSAHQVYGPAKGEDTRFWRLKSVTVDFHNDPPDLRVSAVHGEPVLWARRVLLVAALVSDPRASEYATSLTELASLPWLTHTPCRVDSAPTDSDENWSEPWMGLIRIALNRVRKARPVLRPNGSDFEQDGWIRKEVSIGEAIEHALALLAKGERLRRRAEAELLAGRDEAATEVMRKLAVVKLTFDRIAGPFVHVAYYLELDGQPLDLLIRNGDPIQVDGAVQVLRQIQAEHLRRQKAEPALEKPDTAQPPSSAGSKSEPASSGGPPKLEFTTTDLRATSDPLWQLLQQFAHWMAQGNDYGWHCLRDAVIDLSARFSEAGLKPELVPAPLGQVISVPDGREFYAGDKIPEGETELTRKYFFKEPGYDGWHETIPIDAWPAADIRPRLARWARLWTRERERQLAGTLEAPSSTNKDDAKCAPARPDAKRERAGFLTHTEAAVRFRRMMAEAGYEISLRQAKSAVASAMRQKQPPFRFEGSRKTLWIEGVSFLDWAEARVKRRMDESDHAR